MHLPLKAKPIDIFRNAFRHDLKMTSVRVDMSRNIVRSEDGSATVGRTRRLKNFQEMQTLYKVTTK